MPTLTTLADVKDAFPTWEKYVRLDSTETDATLDDRLTRKIEDAETRLQELLPVTEENITPALVRHLHVITKKNCFDIQHGDRSFDQGQKPQILKDYDDTMETIERYRDGDLTFREEKDGEEEVRINAKRRQFKNDDDWFTDGSYPPRWRH